jgi:hypothetical protein
MPAGASGSGPRAVRERPDGGELLGDWPGV